MTDREETAMAVEELKRAIRHECMHIAWMVRKLWRRIGT